MPVAPNPIWFDDFLGNSVDPRYSLRTYGNASIQIASETGSVPAPGHTYSGNGRVVLDAPYVNTASTASMRIGAQPGSGPPYAGIDLRNWDPRGDLVFEVSGYIPSNPGITGFGSSLGMIGFNDTAGGFLMSMYADTSANKYWTLQLENNGQTNNITSTAVIEVDTKFILRLQTSNSGSEVTMYQNDIVVASYSNGNPPYIAQQNMLFECTCFNTLKSSNRLILDYVYCTMNRQPVP